MLRYIVLLIVQLVPALSQPRCSITGLPQMLPALSQQHIMLDMTRYLQGPNTTIQLNTTNRYVTLSNKYTIKQQIHQLNDILEVKRRQNIITMLGVTSVGRYFIYFSHRDTPHDITAKEVPLQLKDCINHAISDNFTVSLTCKKSQQIFEIAYSPLSSGGQWITHQTKNYINCTNVLNCTNREIEYISSTHVAVIVKHRNNSYIEVWDTYYDRLVGVYDRVYFNFDLFCIIDVEVEADALYILVQNVGVMELKWNKGLGFGVERVFDVGYSENMAVGVGAVVVSKKGALTEYSGRNIFKYEAVGRETIKDLEMSDQYIIVYTQSQVIGYLRGYHTPYFTIPTQNHLIAGTFLSNTIIIQAVSSSLSIQTRLQLITLSHPLLSIPFSVPSNTNITINSVSVIGGQTEQCNVSFMLVRSEEKDMQIFETGDLNKNGTEHLYMNRPGRAEIELSKYGMGPNLQYDVQMFAETVNLTVQVRKLRKVQAINIQGLDKIKVKNTYFSQSCGSFSNLCPFVIDTNTQGMMRFYLCKIQNDYYNLAQKISCSQYFKQFKASEYIHYQLQQPSDEPYFYELAVLASNQNEIRVRKFEIKDNFFTPRITTYFKVEPEEDNKYGQYNVTQLQYDPDQHVLFILLPMQKQIRAYSLLYFSQGVQFAEIVRVNRETFGGAYFVPRSVELDTDGGLWVQGYDQILILDFRRINKIDKVQILSIVNIDVNYVKNYNYTFQVVQKLKSGQVFTPQSNPSTTSGSGFGSVPLIPETYQQQNRKYLILYNSYDVLLMCTVSHIYEIDQKQLQPLPRYGYHVPVDPNQRVIQSLGNSQVLITLLGYGETLIHMIYSLDSLTLVSSFYQSLQTRLSAIPAYFYLSSSNPILLFIQTINNNSNAFAYQVSTPPRMLLTLTQMLGQTLSQQLILRIYNQKYQIRHNIVLSISNYPENMTKGYSYPYPNERRNAADKYIEIDTRGWIVGNVINISYVCTNCEKKDGAWVDVKGKIWDRGELGLAGGNVYEVARPTSTQQTPKLSIALKNLLYTASPQTSQIISSHQLSLSPKDTTLFIKTNQYYHITVALIRSQSGALFLTSYTLGNYKGFELSRMPLPESVKYVLNMEYHNRTIVLLDFSQVYIVWVGQLGDLRIVDNVNQLEAGGAVCWAELLPPIRNNGTQANPYALLLTLCDQGLTYLTFTLTSQILTITSKQLLNLEQRLRNLNIQIPTDASFRRTQVLKHTQKQLHLMSIIRNYNSIVWLFKLRGNVVDEVTVTLMLHRYADFGVLNEVTVGTDGRFVVLSYYGILNNTYEYIHSIYDLQDTHRIQPSQPYFHTYILQTLPTPNQILPHLLTSSTLLLPSQDLHHASIYDIANKFRAVIHNEDQLISQSLFIIPFTPVSSINVEVYIKGIDVVKWEIWEILLILLVAIIGLVLAVFLFKVFFRKYQQNRKLVPLLTDYAEYEEDLQEEIREREEEKRKKSNPNPDTNINASDRGSIGV